jgi:hypothetical protein
MQRDECIDLLTRIPVAEHGQINLILHNRMLVTIDTIIKMEPAYLVLRGREGGSTDEGRGFFVPYEEIAYIRLERVVKVGELRRMFGDSEYVDVDLLAPKAEGGSDSDTKAEIETKTPPPGASPLGSQDPASIAKQNLLDRIRAARANVAGTTGKVGGGKR